MHIHDHTAYTSLRMRQLCSQRPYRERLQYPSVWVLLGGICAMLLAGCI